MSHTSPINKRYRTLEQIGQGGMGTVYQAFDGITQQTIVLKRVLVEANKLQFASLGSESNAQLALAREFRTLAGLRHPHIVAVLDYGFDDQPYYTMEWIEDGQPLTTYAAGKNEDEKIRLLVEVLQALVYLHRRDVLHRDLKPANILVDKTGAVKVLDFGLALQQGADEEAGEQNMVGTLAYMAPELFTDTHASIQSDLYAVGVMAYELFAGRHPYNTTSVTDLLTSFMLGQVDFSPLPPNLAPVVERLLSKVPSERFGSAQATIEAFAKAAGIPVPGESSLLRESFLQASRFVGRQDEFDHLKDELAKCLAGETAVWLVGGESGVGKSRLLEELRTHALVEGALVLSGQGVEQGGQALYMWRNVARHMVLHAECSDREASILKELVPDIEQLLARPIPDPPAMGGPAQQQRLVFTLTAVLQRIAQPVVLLLEDLHWGQENLAPLKHMLSVQEQIAGVLIVGTYRSDETPELPKSLPAAKTLHLQRLSETAIEDLTSSMLGVAQPQVVALLQQETEGNVFFMVETVRALAEEAGALSQIGKRPLPTSVFAGGVQQLVYRRLRKMPEHFTHLLRSAAIAGRLLDLTVLTHLSDAQTVEAFLQAGDDAQIFAIEQGEWRFAHDKLREGVVTQLAADEKPLLHAAVAAAIEAAYPDDEYYYDILLRHWQLANNPHKEKTYLLPVAQHLTEYRADYPQAIELAQRGLELFNKDDARYVTFLNLLAAIKWRTGQFSAAQSWAEQALAQAEQLGDQAAAAESLHSLGIASARLGNHTESEAFNQRSLAIRQKIDDQAGIAASLNSLGNGAWERGNYAQATDYYQQSMAICKAIGQQRRVSVILSNLGLVAEYEGRYHDAHDHYQQSLALRRELSDKRGLVIIYNNLGNVSGRLGDYAASQSYHEQSLALGREIGDQRSVGLSLNNLGNVAAALGNYEQAEAYYQESLALRQAMSEKISIAVSLKNLGYVARVQGSLDKAKRYIDEAFLLFEEIGDKRGLADSLKERGALHMRQGNPAAEATLLEALEISHTINAAAVTQSTLLHLAELNISRSQPERAAVILAWLSAQDLLPEQTERVEALRADLLLPEPAPDLNALVKALLAERQ